MRILTAAQIKDVEKRAFESGIKEQELMYSAGTACANKILAKLDSADAKSVAVFCGNGNNAGDGFVIALHLHNAGAKVTVVMVDKEPSIDAPVYHKKQAEELGIPFCTLADYSESADVIVDCIFGIGFHGEPKAPFDKAIEIINGSNAFVVSVDTPSGTDAATGEASLAVKADLTIAISTLKYAHILPPANEYCGDVVTVKIGIPEEFYDDDLAYSHTITKATVKKSFPKRAKNSHKGTFGHQLNICGSFLMPGAAVICANAALKTGVGLLKCMFPKSIYSVMTSHLCQPIFAPLCENESKTISIGALNNIHDELKWADSVVIGCGIGNNDDTQVITGQVIKTSKAPVVLDADGINSSASFIDILKDRRAPLVITPHPAEMARLVGDSVEEVQNNRIAVAKAFAEEFDCIVVLKGANTVVTDGNEVFVNTTGNSGMAMGGTGDMLAGMIGSFIAQGMSPFDSAKAGVYIHGLCGDICASELSQRGMTVDDMLSLLGALMSEFE